MRISKMSLCAIVALSWGISVNAQKVLTLQEAVSLGLQNSKNLKIDQAAVKQAQTQLLEAKNAQLPSLNITGAAMAMTNADVKMKMKTAAGGAMGDVNVNSVVYGNASVSLPLYAGGRIKYGIESANYLIEASKYAAENDQHALVYAISQAYNNLFKAGEVIKVLQENLTAAQERDASFLRLENNGIIARNDRLKANLQTSNIELQLLEAQSNYSIATVNMNLLLGLNESTELEVDPSYITAYTLDQDLSYFVTKALENRKDLQALMMQKNATETSVKAAKAEEYPTVALTASYFAAEVPNLLTVTNAANIGLGVSYNLDHLWKKNAKLEKAQIESEKLQYKNDLLVDQIKLEVNKDYQNASLAQRKILVYQKAYEQAEENFRITKNKYDNGLATMTELLDANAAKISAKVNVKTAEADARLAYIKLLQSSGTISNNL